MGAAQGKGGPDSSAANEGVTAEDCLPTALLAAGPTAFPEGE